MNSRGSWALAAGVVAVGIGVLVLLMQVGRKSDPDLDDKALAKARAEHQKLEAMRRREAAAAGPETSPLTRPSAPAPTAPPSTVPGPPDSEGDPPAPRTSPAQRIASLKPMLNSAALGDSPPGGMPAEVAERRTAMRAANKLYDQADYEGARSQALQMLEENPDSPRMLRIVVSASCIMGDQRMAQEYFAKLDHDSDREAMARRCSRYGVQLGDSE